MKFATFIDNRFQEVKYEVSFQKEDWGYDVVKDAEIKALHQLLNAYRITCKWLLMPVILVQFLGVKLGLRREPLPVLKIKMEEQKRAEKVAKLMSVEKEPPVSK